MPLAFPEAVARAALTEAAFMYHYHHSSQAWDGRSWLGALESLFTGQLTLARKHEAQARARNERFCATFPAPGCVRQHIPVRTTTTAPLLSRGALLLVLAACSWILRPLLLCSKPAQISRANISWLNELSVA